MRVILHVGMGKAGSSTLQATFAAHRKLLEESGYLYPAIGKENEFTHNPLVMCFQSLRRPRMFGSEENVDAASYLQRLSTIARESKSETMLLSSEFLFYQQPPVIRKLREFLAELFSDIKVVAYLRDPVSYYLSRQQQIVKASAEIIPPSDYSSLLKEGVENYRRVFGSEFAAHDVGRSALIKHCVAQDFRTRYLPEVPEEAFVTISKNESFSAEAMCVLQALHQRGFMGPDNVFTETKRQIVMEVRRAERKLELVSKPVLKPDIEASLATKFRDDVRWVNASMGLSLPVGGARVRPQPEHWNSPRLKEILKVSDSQIDALNALIIAHLWKSRVPKPDRRRPKPTNDFGVEHPSSVQLRYSSA